MLLSLVLWFQIPLLTSQTRTIKCLSPLTPFPLRSAPFLLCSSILLTLFSLDLKLNSLWVSVSSSANQGGWSPCPSELNVWFYLNILCSLLLSFLYVRMFLVTSCRKFNTKWLRKNENSLFLHCTDPPGKKNPSGARGKSGDRH